MPGMQTAGAIIVGLVGLQLGLYIYTAIRQLCDAHTHRSLTRKLLRDQIAAAKALRVQREQARLHWNGYRKFVIARRVEEAEDICSLYLTPHDEKPLPEFEPGQYLTFRLDLPGQDRPVIRCYSLSDCPKTEYYRITVKRVPPPPNQPDAPAGLVSNYVHDVLKEGDILDVQAPRGNFKLNPIDQRPAVLVGGGVGITPMLSMIEAIAQSGSRRETWLFYGVRNGRQHAMREALDQLAAQHDYLHIYTCYSQPDENDVEGRDYHFKEHISAALLQRMLSSNNYEFYVCGPPPMMTGMMKGLAEWGVAKDRIFSEAFGPASGKALSKTAAAPAPKAASGAASAKPKVKKVTFSKSNKSLSWSDSAANLLDFAIEQGVEIESGCRAGNCGTCIVAIKSGKVSCLAEHGADLEDGSCLACISVPDGDLVVDA